MNEEYSEHRSALARQAAAKIQRAKIVSFDIFDTLIGRIVASPSDVFTLMEADLEKLIGTKVSNFPGLRREAEKRAKESALDNDGREDVSLVEIYEVVAQLLELSPKLMGQAAQIEMDWERKCLVPRDVGKMLFKMARAAHKDIVLVSDMYLPRDFIEDVLTQNGYGNWVHFYLSSETGTTKAIGTIFGDVLTDFNCCPEDLLHIGDNGHGDVAVPNKRGIKTFHVPRTTDQLKSRFSFSKKIHRRMVSENRTLSKSVVAQTISDRIFAGFPSNVPCAFKGDPFEFGYSTLGPLVLSFSRWLKANAEMQGCDKLLFLSRDGKILKSAFDLIYPDAEIKTDYVYASRRIANVSSIKKDWDIRKIADQPIYSTMLSTYCQYRFGLRREMLDRDFLRSLGITNVDLSIGNKFDREILLQILLHHREIIFDESRAQADKYSRYLKSHVGGAKKAGIVDIGYAATMQAAISMLIGAPVRGYYLASSVQALGKNIRPEHMAAFLESFGEGQASGLHLGINSHRFFYETLICSDEDSFEGFQTGLTKTIPEFSTDLDALNRKAFVTLAHAGALAFCEEFVARWPLPLNEFWLPGDASVCALDSFLKEPVPGDLSAFMDVEFEDKYGPSLKRVLVASDQLRARTRVSEIWKEGAEVWSRSKQNNKKIQVIKKETRLWRGMRKWEAILVRSVSSEKKFRKYNRDRTSYFSESSIRVVRQYGRLFD